MSEEQSIAIGESMPLFKAHTTSGKNISNKELQGKNVVLYFYPKDSTPGCTLEGRDFAANYAKFEKFNCLVFGISRDNLQSHEKFKEKHCFPFELIADEDEQLCTLFGVIKQKNFLGKKIRGIERSTFLFDSQGKLKQAWRKVKVLGHVHKVLKELQVLNNSA